MEEFKEIFLQLKDYISTQKENAALGAAECLTTILSAAAIGFVIISAILATLLLGGFGVAYWLGDIIGSVAIGFGIMAAAMALLGVFFWIMRRKWIINPIARLMVHIFLEDRKEAEK